MRTNTVYLLPVLLLFLAASGLAQDFEYKVRDKKTTRTLKDPLTGNEFQHPLEKPTEIAWTDRMLREVAVGDHPRLRAIWVSPETGFATYGSEDLWKGVQQQNDGVKSRVREALAKFPYRYRDPEAVPALHRYQLAEMTYAALGGSYNSTTLRARLFLDALYCARDEGNVEAERSYLRKLRPVLAKLSEDESLAQDAMVRAGYLLGEISRLSGNADEALKRFDEAFGRARRWRAGPKVRAPARLGMAELQWKEKSTEELVALTRAKNRFERHAALMLLVDRGQASALRKSFGGKDVALRKDLVHRAASHPHAGLLPLLRKALEDEDAHVSVWAARAIGALGSEDAVQALRRAHEDAACEEDVIVAGLAQAGTPAATEELARLAEHGDGFGGRPKAAQALTLIGGPVSARALVRHVAVSESYNLSGAIALAIRMGRGLRAPLREAIQNEKDPKRLARLLQLAGRYGDKKLAGLAKPHLGSSDAGVRRSAALLAALDGGGKAEIVAALETLKPAHHAPFLEALGRLGGGAQIAKARSADGRKESYPAFLAALRATGYARENGATAELERLLDDRDPQVAAHAAHGLVLMGQWNRVRRRLDRESYVVASGIARGCGEVGLEKAADALIAAYGKRDGAWLGSSPGRWGEYDLPRFEIRRALERIGGKKAKAFLKKAGP